MSSLFTTPFSHDSNVIEATVTNVDPIRFVCTVKTLRGQYFSEVPWLLPTGGSGKHGMHFTPSVGDQVLVWTATTYPVILGSLPRLGTPVTSLNNASGQEIDTDVGNNTNMKNGYTTNPNKPSDLVPGDWFITSEGGGLLALLKNATVILKASNLAQIIVSRFDDLVRVVARNWERFSDVGQQTVANVKGRMYEFLGWDRDLNRSKVGLYELKDVVGDVAAGETLLGEPNTTVTLPAKDNRLRQYWLIDGQGHKVMVDILQDNGKLIVTVQDALTTTKTVRQHDKDLWDTKVQNPSTYSQITIVPGSIKLDQNNGAITVMDASGIRSDFSGHFVHIDSSGVHLG